MLVMGQGVCKQGTLRPREGQGQREGSPQRQVPTPLYRRETESGKGALLVPTTPPLCGTHLGVEGLWLAHLGLGVRGHGGLSRARMTWKTWESSSEDPLGPRLSHLGAAGQPLSLCPCFPVVLELCGQQAAAQTSVLSFTSLRPDQLQREIY